MMTQPALQITDLHKHFGKLHVLRGITTEVRRGEVAGAADEWGHLDERCGRHLTTRTITL
jgi:ABC-type histidine transport system ATPase subunit